MGVTMDFRSSGLGIEWYRDRVLEKCTYFLDVRVWPLHAAVNPQQWLGNFEKHELEYALHLLDSFIYFSEEAVDALLKAGVQGLSRTMKGDLPSLSSAQARWRTFLDTVVVTYVTGESPNVTDSGFAFARKARQVLGIPDAQIVSPEVALEVASREHAPVLFVDDFVGSGSQCIATWHRPYQLNGRTTSFAAELTQRGSAYYCPMVCTDRGLSSIRARCPALIIEPTHIIGPEYSALSPVSLTWPDALRLAGPAFVEKVSRRIGIPDTAGVAVDDWRGFRALGLALAFNNSVPDATMPIFYWEQNGWMPLIRRV
jgi:hypothetical protein